MKKIAVLILAFLSIQTFAQKDKRFEGLDKEFQKVLSEWKAAGFAIAVVEKDKVIYADGFGYQDIAKKVPVSTNTQFAIGSCSKAFTAALLGLLRKDDKVDFDKPVRNYLPQLMFQTDQLNNHVTLRDMMSHRTGLPRHDFSWYLFPSHSKDSLIERIKYLEPSAGLREKWQYNNFMYLAAGRVTEQVTGKSWEENIREKIFLPLGMTQSNVSLKEWVNFPNAATGYDVRKDTIHKMNYYDIAAMSPAGSINSTVNDMSKWMITWINNGKYNGKEILPASYINEAISSQMVMNGALPTEQTPDVFFANYGFGWMTSSYRGHYRVEHGGNIDGFSASTCLFPSDSIGIVVLCNQNGSSVPAVVRNILADRVLGLQRKDWQSTLKSAYDKAQKAEKEAEANEVSNQAQGTKPSHKLPDYEGNFNNKGYGTVEISSKNDSLFAKIGTRNLWLSHFHYDVFQPLEITKIEGIDTSNRDWPKMTFGMSEAGEINRISIGFEPTLKPIIFNRIPKIIQLAADSLQQFVGEFDISGVTIKIYRKGKDGLAMSVPGQPEYELQPVKDDLFTIKDLSGFKVQFIKNEKNEVTELLSIQPNGTFKAKRK